MLFRHQTLLGISAAAALTLVACGKGDAGAATTSTARAAAPAPPPPPAATPAKPAAAAKLPDLMTAEQAGTQFKDNKASMMGQHVKIKGYYQGYTKQGDQLNVGVGPKPDILAKGPLCIFPGSAKAALDKVKEKAMITVSGTVDGDFFGMPKLTGCKLE